MTKFTFEYSRVIYAKDEDDAYRIFESELIDEIENTSVLDNITDSFIIRKLK